MKTQELRKLSDEQLRRRLGNTKLELVKMQARRSQRNVPEYMTGKFKPVRREIARIMTLLKGCG